MFALECGLACLICELTGFRFPSVLLFSVAPKDDGHADVTAIIIIIMIDPTALSRHCRNVHLNKPVRVMVFSVTSQSSVERKQQH